MGIPLLNLEKKYEEKLHKSPSKATKHSTTKKSNSRTLQLTCKYPVVSLSPPHRSYQFFFPALDQDLTL